MTNDPTYERELLDEPNSYWDSFLMGLYDMSKNKGNIVMFNDPFCRKVQDHTNLNMFDEYPMKTEKFPVLEDDEGTVGDIQEFIKFKANETTISDSRWDQISPSVKKKLLSRHNKSRQEVEKECLPKTILNYGEVVPIFDSSLTKPKWFAHDFYKGDMYDEDHKGSITNRQAWYARGKQGDSYHHPFTIADIITECQCGSENLLGGWIEANANYKYGEYSGFASSHQYSYCKQWKPYKKGTDEFLKVQAKIEDRGMPTMVTRVNTKGTNFNEYLIKNEGTSSFYNTDFLRSCCIFGIVVDDLPDHSGEDIVVQLTTTKNHKVLAEHLNGLDTHLQEGTRKFIETYLVIQPRRRASPSRHPASERSPARAAAASRLIRSPAKAR